MKNSDSISHVKGKSLFVDDIVVPEGTLYASVFFSPSAHGLIKNLDLSQAMKERGVTAIFTAKDIPGENQIGAIIPDEELLAGEKVEYVGQPVAVVVAESQSVARKAAHKIKIDLKELPVITDPREANKKGNLIHPPRSFSLGNIKDIWDKCDFVVEGTAESGAQEHLYLETQGAVAIPKEGNNLKIISSTQSPTAVQRAASKVLGLPMHNIEVDVLRLGGGFGGKEDQATHWAVLAGLAASKLKKPVKLILPRSEDIRVTGKRHPYSSDFKIGLNKKGKILAYEATYYQNSGAAADLSPAILERTLFHSTNSYFIPNVKVTAIPCKTNLPPNTAFRGFGGPQAMFVLESAIHKAAEKMGVNPFVIQEKNLLKDKDEFPYGQKAQNSRAQTTWNELNKKYAFEKIKSGIEKYNSENKFLKKGMAVMPICFGISFTNTSMNQASALVHVYTDGSVSVSTAAVEMGQGVNEKIRQVAAEIFSLDIDNVKIETTNTTRAANTSPTAASSAADLNGKVTQIACNKILKRLKRLASVILRNDKSEEIEIKNEAVYLNGKKTKLSWKELIKVAHLKRISLSGQAHYSTPRIYFDKTIEKGRPFAYHVYGTAIIETTVDCMRGIYKIDSVKVVHDFGKSMNKIVDLGQAEGAIMQGIGWMTMEEILFDKNGNLLTNALSTYKVPDMHFTPDNVEINFLKNAENPMGVFKSKAIGEPPFMYGIGAYFSILNAVKSFNPDAEIKFSAPFTPEKVLLSLYKNVKVPA